MSAMLEDVEQVSFASSEKVRARMQAQARKDTAPELALRRALFQCGLRYRVHRRPIPSFRRNLDVVFRGARVAVDVRGCFWHDCPDHQSRPNANASWWAAKLERNASRDLETEHRLRAEGWEPLSSGSTMTLRQQRLASRNSCASVGHTTGVATRPRRQPR